jgi:choline dehydrogenase-like flavoprotein
MAAEVMSDVLQTEVLVIGSGAGGSVTAAMLAEAGRDVVMVEEGPWIGPDVAAPFSKTEMTSKYRNGGLNATLGRPPIAWAEGACVGGGTEVNSGLYHRPPAAVLEEWRDREQVDDCDAPALRSAVERVEAWLSVNPLPEAAPPASTVLERGAAILGWQAVEVPRWFRYDDGRAVKQTMTRTMVPRAQAAGARVVPRCRAARLLRTTGRILGARCWMNDRDLTISADHVFVCAGAVETPALLQRSGIRHNVGSGLKMHPTIKLAARFDHEVGDHESVPVHQVKEFAPHLTLGGSVSRPGYVALALADSWATNAQAMREWDRVAVYHAAIRSDGHGRVLAVPGLRTPLVSYRLTEADLSRLARGLVHLAELLFAAGAVELYPSITGAPSLRRPADIAGLWAGVTRADANLMTVHLCSSVPMGENRISAGADSYGRVWGYRNLRVNDASLLPDAPGVNPQGTIMAFAVRNVDHFLATA